ncbi:hypothetical protein PIB30_097708 [Stylosanthes scabra]|uniref:Uncharacterized protein n=1 Tax=Stylosanthes scabra TaxID=79078 RepID=A0ABU6YV96_9FABA|nr:hypothetical protein [Stylosanthes scabra]
MGNCMACHSQPRKQTRGPLVEERRKVADASTAAAVEKMSPGCPASSKHYIRSVKIVVTTEQLALLLSGAKKLEIRNGGTSVGESPVYRGCRKWLPSLPSIQEVQNY